MNAIAFEMLDLLDVDNYVARCDMEIIISVINHVSGCMQQATDLGNVTKTSTYIQIYLCHTLLHV